MNYKISKRAASLSPSLTLAIDAKAKQMKAEGMDVVGFGAGEPDFDTPNHIKAAAEAALKAGFTKYTPSSGIPELRQAIADKFKTDSGLSYKPSQIIVSCGGKHSCYNVILATCEEGDEVIIPSPYWLSYPEMVKLAAAKPVIVETTDKTEFKITPEQLRAAITPRTRLFILNSPSNPTGSLYSPEEIKVLGSICVEKGVLIMSDEIYDKLVYDGAKHVSVATFSEQFKEHTIIVHGFAKAYSMTGWRLGYLAAPEPIAKAIDAVQSHSTSNPTSFAQKGAVAALTGPQDHLAIWLAEYSKRRSYAHARLNKMPGVTCVNAKGAFYLFPNISGTGVKSSQFCASLLEEE
jgi:aspartate aminotransferase